MEKQKRELAYGHEVRGGVGEMYGNSNMETYIAICEIDSQWEFAVWLRKLKQGLCINLDSIFKSRDITLPTKVHLVKALVFPVVIYGCESWTVKKAER